MNKTVFASVCVATCGVVLVAGLFISSAHRVKIENIASQERVTVETIASAERLKTETRDRFTVCIDTVMARSIEAKHPITANEAKDICLHSEKF